MVAWIKCGAGSNGLLSSIGETAGTAHPRFGLMSTRGCDLGDLNAGADRYIGLGLSFSVIQLN